MRKGKAVFISAVLLLVILFVYQYSEAQFQLKNIQFSNSYLLEQHDFQTLEKIAAQKFHYLARGKQSYAFLSDDGHYVLKFFDAHALRPFPFSGGSGGSQKEAGLFEGYRLGFLKNRENSGLIYVSLGADSSIPYSVSVRDRFGIAHQIPLNAVPFVLQVKAVPTRNVITALLHKGDLAQAKMRLRQIVDLYLDEYSRGVYDDDHNFMYNTGFVGERPIRIDLGRLTEDSAYRERAVYFEDLKKVAIDRVDGWMQRHFPHYRTEIVDNMRDKLAELNF